MSVNAAEEEVARYRRLAATDPSTYEPELGLALYGLCMSMEQANGPVTRTYLERLEEAIALHRRLLTRNPKSVPQLGTLLCWLAVAKYQLGWHDEARDLVEEGLGLIRSSARTFPELFETRTAMVLSLAGHILSAAGDHTGAVQAARDAVAQWRQLIEEEPGEHEAWLASALHTLCFALQDAGRAEEIAAPAEESIRITRPLVTSGAAGPRLLANGLDLKTSVLWNSGRHQEALSVAAEAVAAYEQAIREGDRLTTLNYTNALINLSSINKELGHAAEATAAAETAFVECLRRTRDVTELATLSSTASKLASLMIELGMRRRAEMLVKFANRRLDGRPYGLGKVLAWLRGR